MKKRHDQRRTGGRMDCWSSSSGLLDRSRVVSLRMRTRAVKTGESVAANGSARSGVLYARVSSKEQEQGYSIPAQQELLRGYATQMSVAVAQEFVDVESAKISGRPGFVAMVDYLRQNPGCRVVLAEKTDRLYRNLKDYVTLDELSVDIHLVKENEILTKSSRSPKIHAGDAGIDGQELH